MTESKPRFIWYELMTSDQGAAEVLYRAVVGWRMADAGQPGMRYAILSAGDRGTARTISPTSAASLSSPIPGVRCSSC